MEETIKARRCFLFVGICLSITLLGTVLWLLFGKKIFLIIGLGIGIVVGVPSLLWGMILSVAGRKKMTDRLHPVDYGDILKQELPKNYRKAILPGLTERSGDFDADIFDLRYPAERMAALNGEEYIYASEEWNLMAGIVTNRFFRCQVISLPANGGITDCFVEFRYHGEVPGHVALCTMELAAQKCIRTFEWKENNGMEALKKELFRTAQITAQKVFSGTTLLETVLTVHVRKAVQAHTEDTNRPADSEVERNS